MSRIFRSLTLYSAVAPAIVALVPSSAAASDFGPMAMGILMILAAFAGAALVLGIATAGGLAWYTRRKWVWFLIPVFAVCWLGVILLVHEVWINWNARTQSARPETVVPVPFPAPEGTRPQSTVYR